ncbi:MAG: hypothetical protein JOY62_04115 [Acidobacteriaceae bacterium]|nr:hypothetical protein [Acidobacteriaceae bacterium]MBV9779138.1 hypothetical protein [Acidobacteriaceae bacterium]
MAQFGGAIARYHQLLHAPKYGDLAWAQEFAGHAQEQLAHAGPLSATVLRPHFISASELARLTRATERLAAIFDAVETIALHSPSLLDRLRLLPAEKMLAAIPSGYSRFNISSRMDANLQNGSLSLHGFEPASISNLTYSEALADLFLDLNVVKDFKRGRFKLTKVGGAKYLLPAVLQAWKEFGGKRLPNVAVVEFSEPPASGSSKSSPILDLFNGRGVPARIVSPEELEYSGGKLRAGDFEIDVVLRCLLTRDLLIRFDLSHPLLLAYRDRAVCVVNSFRSEIAQRRALFDLITDEGVTTRLAAADRKLIREFVPWTRLVSPRKTTYREREIDLPEFIRRKREQLVLRPNEDTDGHRVFIGAELDQAAWDRALRTALQTPYVVQERSPAARRLFPLLQYGELQMKELDVSLRPYIFSGKMHGATAALRPVSGISATPISIAPVLLLEGR